jgi:hypothetical protein
LSLRKQTDKRTLSQIRSRIEHLGPNHIQQAGDLLARPFGIVRARAQTGLRDLAYHIDWMGMLRATSG